MLMYLVAIIGDIVSLFPAANIPADGITAGALWAVGKAEGINIFGPGNIGPTMATMLVEFLPGPSAFPTWTLRVFFARRKAKKEKQKVATKAATRSSSGLRL